MIMLIIMMMTTTTARRCVSKVYWMKFYRQIKNLVLLKDVKLKPLLSN